jgi:hypothetical protein
MRCRENGLVLDYILKTCGDKSQMNRTFPVPYLMHTNPQQVPNCSASRRLSTIKGEVSDLRKHSLRPAFCRSEHRHSLSNFNEEGCGNTFKFADVNAEYSHIVLWPVNWYAKWHLQWSQKSRTNSSQIVLGKAQYEVFCTTIEVPMAHSSKNCTHPEFLFHYHLLVTRCIGRAV